MEIAIKMIGACMVLLSSTGIGIYFSNKEKGRLQNLKDLKKDMCMLRGDIHYGSTPLPDAMESISERSADNFTFFFRQVAKELKNRGGRSFAQIWDKGIEKDLKDICLNTNDLRQLNKLGETLGYLDKEMQTKHIDLYLEQLELELEEAAATIKEKTRLYNMLGILSGLFIIVVMI